MQIKHNVITAALWFVGVGLMVFLVYVDFHSVDGFFSIARPLLGAGFILFLGARLRQNTPGSATKLIVFAAALIVTIGIALALRELYLWTYYPALMGKSIKY